jgi:hypothetical protein
VAAKRKLGTKDPPRTDGTPPQDLSELDKLIEECYKELCTSLKGKAKLGDFIKMMELRRKLAPSDSAQREFWQMLERIRSETLPAKEESKLNSRKAKAKPHDDEV